MPNVIIKEAAKIIPLAFSFSPELLLLLPFNFGIKNSISLPSHATG
jgi:hypothetical protein